MFVFICKECTLAVKAPSRGHTSATSLHTLASQQPNATVIAPHGASYGPIPPEVVHHIPYRVLQPSYQTYLPPLSGPIAAPPKPGQISNDLGPPIFMPRKLK